MCAWEAKVSQRVPGPGGRRGQGGRQEIHGGNDMWTEPSSKIWSSQEKRRRESAFQTLSTACARHPDRAGLG